MIKALEVKKSELFDNSSSSLFDLLELTGCYFLADGGFLLQKVIWNEKRKVSHLIDDFKSFIFNHYSKTNPSFRK